MDGPPVPTAARPPAPGKKTKASAKSPKVSSLLRSQHLAMPATGGSIEMPVAEEWAGIAKRFDIPQPNAGEAAKPGGAVVLVPPSATVMPSQISDEWSQIAGRMDE